METVIDLLRAFSLNLLEVIILAIPIFFVGYKLGVKKVNKLKEELYGLQKQVLDLNEELLTGNSKTPVIEIKPEQMKVSNIAK